MYEVQWKGKGTIIAKHSAVSVCQKCNIGLSFSATVCMTSFLMIVSITWQTWHHNMMHKYKVWGSVVLSTHCNQCRPKTHYPFIMATNVHDPGATSRVLCVYVYALWCMSLPLTPLPGLSMCMCIYLPLTPLAGFSVCMCTCLPLAPLPGIFVAAMSCPWCRFQGYPVITTLTLLPGICVCMFMCLCVCAPEGVSRTMYKRSRHWATARAECMFTHGGVAQAIFATTSFVQCGVSEEQAN